MYTNSINWIKHFLVIKVNRKCTANHIYLFYPKAKKNSLIKNSHARCFENEMTAQSREESNNALKLSE